jgi:hypothetical protein
MAEELNPLRLPVHKAGREDFAGEEGELTGIDPLGLPAVGPPQKLLELVPLVEGGPPANVSRSSRMSRCQIIRSVGTSSPVSSYHRYGAAPVM